MANHRVTAVTADFSKVFVITGLLALAAVFTRPSASTAPPQVGETQLQLEQQQSQQQAVS